MAGNQNYKQHFFISQFQTFIIALLITGFMQYSNSQAYYIWYCFPMLFVYMLIYFLVFWYPKKDCTTIFSILNIIIFFVCMPCFFGVYFGIFHKVQKFDFVEAQDCQIVGQMFKNLHGNEIYVLNYVKFQYKGQDMLGYSCMSNQNRHGVSSNISPYSFYEKGESYQCGPNAVDDSYSTQTKRLLEMQQPNSIRITRVGGSSRSASRFRLRSSLLRSSGNKSSDTCSQTFKFSKVKLASWMCQSFYFDYQDITLPKPSFVSEYGNQQQARLNGVKGTNLRLEFNFMMISYEKEAYYPKFNFVCLILFSYYPFIIALNVIFQLTSNKIQDCFNRNRKPGTIVPDGQQMQNVQSNNYPTQQNNIQNLNYGAESARKRSQELIDTPQINEVYIYQQTQFVQSPLQQLSSPINPIQGEIYPLQNEVNTYN